MKSATRLSSLFCVLALFGSAGCSNIHTLARGGVPTVTLRKLQADLAAGGGQWKPPAGGIIVQVEKGSRIPVTLVGSAPFATLEAGDNRLRLEADLYVYLCGGEVEISPDGQRWASIRHPRSMKQLFGIGRGEFAFGAGITKDAGPIVNATLKLLPR